MTQFINEIDAQNISRIYKCGIMLDKLSEKKGIFAWNFEKKFFFCFWGNLHGGTAWILPDLRKIFCGHSGTKMASILEQYEHELQTGGNLPSSRQILADEPVSFILYFAFFIPTLV